MPSRLSSFTAPLLFLFSSKAFGDGALDQAFVSLGMDNQKDEKGRLLSAASAEDLKVRGRHSWSVSEPRCCVRHVLSSVSATVFNCHLYCRHLLMITDCGTLEKRNKRRTLLKIRFLYV